MALSAERNTQSRLHGDWNYPVAANVKIYAGALVALNAGFAAPGATATGRIAVGRSEQTVSNLGGAAGDVSVNVRRGIFLFKNSTSTDAIAQADVGADCFIVDDEQVAKTSASNTRSKAGVIRGIDAGGVWVEI